MAKDTAGGRRASSSTSSSGSGRVATKSSAYGSPRSTMNKTVIRVSATQTPDMSKAYDDFMDADYDERVDAIANAMNKPVPNHLSQEDFQKVIYNLDLNDKPDLVDDDVLDSMSGKDLYRTVNDVYDKSNDIHYSPKQIIQQIQKGSVTRTSATSLYGRGVYFADSYYDSAGYGHRSNDISQTAMARAKLNGNAKVISYNKAIAGASNEISNGTKLGQVLKQADGSSRPSIYALAHGYNVIDNQYGYIVVLNRRAMTMSKDIKAKGSRWK